MRIGIIGAGSVGQTMAAGLMAQGHEVRLGVRDASEEALAKPRQNAATLAEWRQRTGGTVATMAEAARWGEVAMNAGRPRSRRLGLAGEEALAGKVLVDIANPLDFSHGMPPFLQAEDAGPTSLGEAIQAAFPRARVVKAFNTVTAAVMVEPSLIPGEHDLFLSGNDAAAKDVVRGLAEEFGWRSFVDLCDIKGARAQEAVLPIWVRLWTTTGTPMVNLRAVRA